MDIFKKEWKAILIGIWLVIITVVLFRINTQLGQFQETNKKIASTLDTVESVVISTDANVIQTAKKVGQMESNTDYLVKRLRRR